MGWFERKNERFYFAKGPISVHQENFPAIGKLCQKIGSVSSQMMSLLNADSY